MRILPALLLLALAHAPLLAQARELDWPSISVTAHLDADGRLHVSERQVMRLSGDWNGGERRFDLPFGQELALERILRSDTPDGPGRELAQGDLATVDHFDWTDRSTLRWRSRLPTDPPFANTVLTYTLEFTYGNIIQPEDDGTFRLDHDFALRDRTGPIHEFSVRLSFDPIWDAGPRFDGVYRATDLEPGEGYVVVVPLKYQGAGPPPAVRMGAPAGARDTLILVLLAGTMLLFLRLVVRERKLGRFAALPSPAEITPEWLQAHVFSHLPEVAGAAWDDSTAAPEVAATLARLVQEKKLSSSVETEKRWLFKRDILTLRIEVDRAQFRGHEKALIEALFKGKEDTTDTDRVRKRYEKTGFDPASLIRKRLANLVEATTPGKKGEKPSLRLTLALLATAALLMAVAGVRDTADAPVGLAGVGIALLIYMVAVSQSALWRLRVHRLVPHMFRFLVPVAFAVLLLALRLDSGVDRASLLMLTGLTLWQLGLISSVFNQGRSRQSAERIVIRKRLTAARLWFRDELRRTQPQLKDEWFPWLIAFGLGSHIDKWFRAFGGAVAPAMATAASINASRSSSSGGSSWTGFGGGGGFSGGGSSASFAAAVGGIAASVPSPSSGGSGGGGGGGGGSSGGGGGGGW